MFPQTRAVTPSISSSAAFYSLPSHPSPAAPTSPSFSCPSLRPEALQSPVVGVSHGCPPENSPAFPGDGASARHSGENTHLVGKGNWAAKKEPLAQLCRRGVNKICRGHIWRWLLVLEASLHVSLPHTVWSSGYFLPLYFAHESQYKILLVPKTDCKFQQRGSCHVLLHSLPDGKTTYGADILF